MNCERASCFNLMQLPKLSSRVADIYPAIAWISHVSGVNFVIDGSPVVCIFPRTAPAFCIYPFSIGLRLSAASCELRHRCKYSVGLPARHALQCLSRDGTASVRRSELIIRSPTSSRYFHLDPLHNENLSQIQTSNLFLSSIPRLLCQTFTASRPLHQRTSNPVYTILPRL